MSVFRCLVCKRGPDAGALFRVSRTGREGVWACSEHRERIKCVVPDCVRTASREKRGSEWICSEHWRRYVPPRSRLRRLYHAHFRRAKRLGWDDKRTAQFWRFWEWLVDGVIARATEGHIDMTEINKLFGWTDGDQGEAHGRQ